MKRATKILLSTVIACIITSASLICTGKDNGGFTNLVNANTTKNDSVISVPVTKSFKEIDINMALAYVFMGIGDNYAIKIEYSKETDEIDWQIRDDKLRIFTISKLNSIKRKICPKVTIFIPKGNQLNKISVSNTLGKINIEKLNTKKVELYSMQGSINLNEINTENLFISGSVGRINIDKLDAKGVDLGNSTGDINLSNVNIENLTAKNAIGNIIVTGDIVKSVDIGNATGDVKLDLKRPENYYDCKLECSMGKTEVNGHKINEQTWIVVSGSQTKSNNKSDKLLKIKNCMGDIDVNFES